MMKAKLNDETITQTKKEGVKTMISETAFIKTLQKPGVLSMCVTNDSN
jgi:hypothetical protein